MATTGARGVVGAQVGLAVVDGAAAGIVSSTTAAGGATAGASAAAAATGPALASTLGAVQMFSALGQVACDVAHSLHAEAAEAAARQTPEERLTAEQGEVAMGDVCTFGESLAWASMRSPAVLDATTMAQRVGAANSTALWLGIAVACCLALLLPTVYVARRVLAARWREERRADLAIAALVKADPLSSEADAERRAAVLHEQQRRRRRTTLFGPDGLLRRSAVGIARFVATHVRSVSGGGVFSEADRLANVARGVVTTIHDRPPSMLHKYANLGTRIIHYLAMIGLQPVARQCAFAMFNDASNGAPTSLSVKVLAGAAFVLWPVALLVHLYRLVAVRVVAQRRAALIRDPRRTQNVLCWMDMPVVYNTVSYQRAKATFYYSGFARQNVIAQHFAAFSDVRCSWPLTVLYRMVMFARCPSTMCDRWIATVPSLRISTAEAGGGATRASFSFCSACLSE